MARAWPRGNPIHIHLNTDEALRILDESRPKACIMTHFGMRMLNVDPEKEAEYLQDETGIPIIAAVDGMKAIMGDDITIVGPRKKDDPVILAV